VAHRTTVPATLERTSVSLEGRVPHYESSWPARGHDAPLADLRLVRGPRPFQQVSASLEGFSPSSEFLPRSRPPSTRGASPAPPPGALSALTCRGRPGQKRIPAMSIYCHNLGIQPRRCSSNPPLCSHPRRCTSAVQDGWCHSLTLCHPLPSFLHAAPLERG
jgi:hypothetical protein